LATFKYKITSRYAAIIYIHLYPQYSPPDREGKGISSCSAERQWRNSGKCYTG